MWCHFLANVFFDQVKYFGLLIKVIVFHPGSYLFTAVDVTELFKKAEFIGA
jgi:hypothetical protein